MAGRPGAAGEPASSARSPPRPPRARVPGRARRGRRRGRRRRGAARARPACLGRGGAEQPRPPPRAATLPSGPRSTPKKGRGRASGGGRPRAGCAGRVGREGRSPRSLLPRRAPHFRPRDPAARRGRARPAFPGGWGRGPGPPPLCRPRVCGAARGAEARRSPPAAASLLHPGRGEAAAGAGGGCGKSAVRGAPDHRLWGRPSRAASRGAEARRGHVGDTASGVPGIVTREPSCRKRSPLAAGAAGAERGAPAAGLGGRRRRSCGWAAAAPPFMLLKRRRTTRAGSSAFF